MIVILVISTYKLPCWDSSLASIGGTAERKLHQLTYICTSAYVLQCLKFVCGASNYINWRLRTRLNHKSLWTDEWVKSSVHKLHKMLEPKLISLPESPSAKIKTCTLSKAPPPVWPHHQHTHVWICPGTISIPVYRPKHTFDLKFWLCWLSKKIWHPH